MFKPTSIFARSLLALACLAGSAAAFAGPIYHVSIDSTGHTGTGVLMMSFLTEDPAPTVVANITGWTADGFLGSGKSYNEASIDFGAHTLSLTSGLNGYLFDAGFGGKFDFDVSFSADNAPYQAIFGVALADYDGNYVEGDGDLVDITLSPDSAADVYANADYAKVTSAAVNPVPEPSTLLSMVTGLALLGFGLRRRAR